MKERKRSYEQRIREVEHASLTPLVLAWVGRPWFFFTNDWQEAGFIFHYYDLSSVGRPVVNLAVVELLNFTE